MGAPANFGLRMSVSCFLLSLKIYGLLVAYLKQPNQIQRPSRNCDSVCLSTIAYSAKKSSAKADSKTGASISPPPPHIIYAPRLTPRLTQVWRCAFCQQIIDDLLQRANRVIL